METIFKSAVDRIKAKESTKRKTENYLMESLADGSGASDSSRIKRTVMKRVIPAACAAVFVCAASVSAYACYKTPTSYLSIDINPSVELGVNPFGKIVSAAAYNEDGQTILNGQNVMGSDVESAVKTLVASAAQKGFVAKDGSTVIAVTSETDDSTAAAELENTAAQGADSAIKSEGDTATVQKENVALERRDEAHKLGITPGKLNLIQKLQALDSSITVDEYKDAKVTDIMKKFVELKKAAHSNENDSSSDSPSSSASENSDTASQAVSSVGEESDASSTSKKTAAVQSRAQSGQNKAKQSTAASSDAGNSAPSTVSSQPESDESASSGTGSGKSDNAANSGDKSANSHTNHGRTVANSHKK